MENLTVGKLKKTVKKTKTITTSIDYDGKSSGKPMVLRALINYLRPAKQYNWNIHGGCAAVNAVLTSSGLQ